MEKRWERLVIAKSHAISFVRIGTKRDRAFQTPKPNADLTRGRLVFD
jgi:hypothetical protein